jgi:hypothetical protein
MTHCEDSVITFIGYPVIILPLLFIFGIILFYCGYILNRKLEITKMELSSCKSSLSSKG